MAIWRANCLTRFEELQVGHVEERDRLKAELAKIHHSSPAPA